MSMPFSIDLVESSTRERLFLLSKQARNEVRVRSLGREPYFRVRARNFEFLWKHIFRQALRETSDFEFSAH